MLGCAPDPTPSPVQQLAAKKTPAEEPAAPDDPGGLTVLRFLGKQRAAAITRATRAESFRVAAWGGGKGVAGDLHGHKITAQGPALTTAQLDELRRMILDEKSYLFPVAKECEFEPGVAIRLYGGDPKLLPVDVLLCFSCDEWEFHGHGDAAHEDFDPVRPALVKLVRALFPDDAKIQALTEKGK
ncbi:MAG: hypothetical protein ACYTGX_12645 [Planctomycetota bacterium]